MHTDTSAIATATAEGRSAGLSNIATNVPVVFVVDDDISMRESLEGLILRAGYESESFVSAQTLLARPIPAVPSCLILDLSLPDLNGLEVQKRLAVERPAMPVIFVTDHSDVSASVQAMKAGAVEFLMKPFGDEALLRALRDALERSQRALETEARSRVLRAKLDSLTPREREVMTMVAAGLLNRKVAGELGITEGTVKAHRGRVMRKMGADSLPALVHMVARLRMASPA